MKFYIQRYKKIQTKNQKNVCFLFMDEKSLILKNFENLTNLYLVILNTLNYTYDLKKYTLKSVKFSSCYRGLKIFFPVNSRFRKN